MPRRLDACCCETPITLENAYVRLEPLSPDHAEDLAEAAIGLEHAWYTSVPTPDAIETDIAQRLELAMPGR